MCSCRKKLPWSLLSERGRSLGRAVAFSRASDEKGASGPKALLEAAQWAHDAQRGTVRGRWVLSALLVREHAWVFRRRFGCHRAPVSPHDRNALPHLA